MDVSKTKIETERLELVPGTMEYAEQIFSEYRDPVIQYMNYRPPESLDILKERIQEREVNMEKGIQLFMAILLKESKEFIGIMALENLNKRNPEMGGWLKESAHGSGYGREAAAALKEWADQHVDYDHILWPCATANTSSCKLAESLGGKVHKEYEKKTARGNVWPFVDYWIYKN